MKLAVSLSVGVAVCLGAFLAEFGNDYPLAVVRHRWQEVITESNHAALRPGSVYDILTHFEQNSGLNAAAQFKYLFFDTGPRRCGPDLSRVLSSRLSGKLAAVDQGRLFR